METIALNAQMQTSRTSAPAAALRILPLTSGAPYLARFSRDVGDREPQRSWLIEKYIAPWGHPRFVGSITTRVSRDATAVKLCFSRNPFRLGSSLTRIAFPTAKESKSMFVLRLARRILRLACLEA
jgi:hypothetical protein